MHVVDCKAKDLYRFLSGEAMHWNATAQLD